MFWTKYKLILLPRLNSEYTPTYFILRVIIIISLFMYYYLIEKLTRTYMLYPVYYAFSQPAHAEDTWRIRHWRKYKIYILDMISNSICEIKKEILIFFICKFIFFFIDACWLHIEKIVLLDTIIIRIRYMLIYYK